MAVYRSKVDAWLVAVCVAVVALCAVPMLTDGFSWVALVINLVVMAAVILPLFSIKYVINDNKLTVSCLWVFTDSFAISKIESLRTTRTFLSAPAASIDRIEVKCGRRSVIVSPLRREEFIDHLCRINPDIVVK